MQLFIGIYCILYFEDVAFLVQLDIKGLRDKAFVCLCAYTVKKNK